MSDARILLVEDDGVLRDLVERNLQVREHDARSHSFHEAGTNRARANVTNDNPKGETISNRVYGGKALLPGGKLWLAV